ncbi:hypothetical protein LTR08_004786 [Meristemomyces frigidus]|nr:hypothetical protein LTR08_004786 [Meristemomyces frigidus]
MLSDREDYNSKRSETGLRSVSQPKTSFSDDTFSTFSCVSDLLPDETADINLIEVAGTDNDLVAIKRIAAILARHRNVDPSTVMPKLVEMFGAQPDPRTHVPDTMHAAHFQTPHSFGKAVTTIRKHPSLMAKASGFFQKKLRPQLTIDTVSVAGRRFSFETDDDADNIILPVTRLVGTSGRLRKSTSLMTLAEMAQMAATIQRALSPVAQSPNTSAPPSEPRRGSRIPTPVHSPGYLAKPRQEREDSASSLLTAINNTGNTWREDSVSSSSYSSPSASRVDMIQQPQSAERTSGGYQRSGSRNRLLGHTNVLRGSALAAAAAKSACYNGITEHVGDSDTQHISPVVQSKASHSTVVSRLNMREAGDENVGPMGPLDDLRE